MVQHCETLNRSVQVVNLDPAAEYFNYPVMAGEHRVYTCLDPVVQHHVEQKELCLQSCWSLVVTSAQENTVIQ